jgi:hypothetical protein
MRDYYVAWLERGRNPDTFWRSTFGEVTIMIRAYEFQDEVQWMHTSALMALTANINRGKNARPFEWNDFNPYAKAKAKVKAAPKLGKKHHDLFAKMTQKLNSNGEKQRDT